MAARINHVLPKHLYRFRGINKFSFLRREMEAIENNYIWASRFDQLNDPMEGFFDFKNNDEYWDEIHIKDKSTVIAIVKAAKGICSFSENIDNPLMWSHYADGFNGIAIEYNFELMQDYLNDDVSLSKVAYENNVMNFNIFDKNIDVDNILSVKNSRWGYEREWRVISFNQGKVRLAGNPISAIYVGMRVSDSNCVRIKNFCKKKNILTKKMELNRYSIDFNSV